MSTSQPSTALPPDGDQVSGSYSNALPPPPPRGVAIPPSPRRRNHAVQPPTLTTALNAFMNGGYSSTPNSTTSLSSPFSQNNPSPYLPSPGGAARGISPMATMLSTAYSAPYNPREWVPISTNSSHLSGPTATMQQAASHILPRMTSQPSDLVGSPPPPYSPRPDNPTPISALSPVDSILTHASSSQSNTPTSATQFTSPSLASVGRHSRPRPLSMAYITDSGPNAAQNFYPPPPPAQHNRSSRPSSRLGLDRLFHHSNTSSPATDEVRMSSAPTVPKGNDPLQGQSLAFQQPVQSPASQYIPRPPASRRAASAGPTSDGGYASCSTSQSGSRSPSRKHSWEPGMPLPGPPSGPPPSALRSHSAGSVNEASENQIAAPVSRPTNRHPPALGTSLGPVPPTPAGWTEEGHAQTRIEAARLLHIDTTNIPGISNPIDDAIPESSTLGESPEFQQVQPAALSRSSARRGSSANGIRERRNTNRAIKDRDPTPLSAISISSNPWAHALEAMTPADSRVTNLDQLSTYPESRPAVYDGEDLCKFNSDINTETISGLPPDEPIERSAQATPTAESTGQRQTPLGRFTPTPPFSPTAKWASPTTYSDQIREIPPKALPTPPLNFSRNRLSLRDLSIPQVINLSNSASPAAVSLNGEPSAIVSTVNGHLQPENFIVESLRRHEAFLKLESAAGSDEERLRIFADYILAESCIRRRRYAKVWDAGGFDEASVRERLFKVTNTGRRSSLVPKITTTQANQSASPGSTPQTPARPDSAWWSNFQPCLSPIASMSNDEMSSRGRTPSRWWESSTGPGSDGVARKFERSKRESKYMGLQREAVEAMQLGADTETTGSLMDPHPESTEFPSEKSDPEKFGFYDEDNPSPRSVLHFKRTESPLKLDISRFITLPPPFPRHHPAVNNSHPGLVSYRTLVRNLSDLSDVKSRKSRQKLSAEALQRDSQQKISEARQNFKSNIQAQIEEGSISYAEAAEAEEALKLEEQRMKKQCLQAEFESFQDVVLNPLHNMLNDRASQINVSINELQQLLDSDAQALNPDQPQEEGDEQPELLEKLTQLKWLFETREQIHKELFDLLTERNEKYKAIVLLPYIQANNAEKIRDTEAFFVRDSRDRRLTFENESLARHEQFLRIIEDNVSRGVELQSSAFWDIAPGLLDVLQKIPMDLREFEGIQIPDKEYEENQSYYAHPYQYLYSLLVHAERSSYQFIESQTNLHCLLHEAKTGVVVARCKAMEAQSALNGDEGAARLMSDVTKIRDNEEALLTRELKQKVSMIEEQWAEALGNQLQATKAHVKDWLVGEGGWDEMEQAEG